MVLYAMGFPGARFPEVQRTFSMPQIATMPSEQLLFGERVEPRLAGDHVPVSSFRLNLSA
jgi:hypothetical protein